DALGAELRFAELRLAPETSARQRRRAPEDVPLSRLVLARALSRRRSRHGLGKLIRRRLWAHPGIVATGTDASWPWALRRLWYQSKVAGLDGLAASIARLTPPGPTSRPSDETSAASSTPTPGSRP
ncbi:MAG: hypothetical protein MI919_19215, partial [Holophagales bacterium]|nr:hypothetical protein [Holophagales bacterium]